MIEVLGAFVQLTCIASMPSSLSAALTFQWEKEGTPITSGEEMFETYSGQYAFISSFIDLPLLL